jgi:hypothetical protein
MIFVNAIDDLHARNPNMMAAILARVKETDYDFIKI